MKSILVSQKTFCPGYSRFTIVAKGNCLYFRKNKGLKLIHTSFYLLCQLLAETFPKQKPWKRKEQKHFMQWSLFYKPLLEFDPSFVRNSWIKLFLKLHCCGGIFSSIQIFSKTFPSTKHKMNVDWVGFILSSASSSKVTVLKKHWNNLSFWYIKLK